MGVIPFCLVLSCGFAVRYPFPEIRDEVPGNFQDNRTFETRMATNLMTVESIGFGQFVRVSEIRVAAPDV
jgi:hypothetical protein